jgi:MipA family protein
MCCRPTACLLLSTLACAAVADTLPLWEAGFGAALVDFPDYRGADERHTFALPFPYLEYRGEFLKADRESIRGVLFKRPGLELNLSVHGSIPVNSSDNSARAAMPNLDPTLEVGPNLEFKLSRTERSKLDLRLPLRGVMASDFRHVNDAGWVFQPQVNLDLSGLGADCDWKFGAAAGPLFATRRFHQYFYGVAPQFSTAIRPAYDAPGGYSGSQITLALSKRFSQFWIGGFARYDRLNGAAFIDSPLVKSHEAFAAGVALAWIFARSAEQVDAEK